MRGRGVTTGASASTAIRPTGAPSRSTVTVCPSGVRLSSTTVEPPTAAVCTPGTWVRRRGASPGAPAAYDQTWISVGSSLAVKNTRSPMAPTTSRTSSPGGVVRPPMSSPWVSPPGCAGTTSAPDGRRSGVPVRSATHARSWARCRGRVSPVAGSTARTYTERWSRVCTETTGPRRSQSAVATYSNAGSVHAPPGWSGPAAAGSRTATRSPDTRTRCSDTSALTVPAAGYAITRGGRSGSAGSLRYLRCTMDVSTRATSSASPDGDHQ